MTNHRIWAPWRLRYVKHARDSDECIFCTKPAQGDDRATLIVHRGRHCYVILNLFPYTNGHLMVAPFEHLGRVQEIEPEVMGEMIGLAQRAMTVLERIYEPEGFNMGINQGRVAGAGVEGHIHLHVVPRWAGDNNYMPVVADTRVMPQSLEESYDALLGGFSDE